MIRKLSRKAKKIWAELALLSVEMIVITAVFFVSLISFVVIVRRVFYVKDNALDQKVFDWIEPHMNETNTTVLNFITLFGKHEFLIPANLAIIAFYLFVRKHKWYSIKVPAIAISSLLLMFGLKNFFSRERPDEQLLEVATNFSFPSGHALMGVTFYGLLIYIVWHSVKNRQLKWILMSSLVIWILLIGFSRLYLRRHYFSDVLAGYCIGFLWLSFALWLLNKMEKYSRAKLNPVVNESGPVVSNRT